MSYLNSVTLIGFVGADPEQRTPAPAATARSSPCSPSPRSGPGRTRRTSGRQRSSGIASRCFDRALQTWCSRPSRRARTFSSKAASLARPTTSRTEKARRRKRPRSFRGPSALMPSANSTAANPRPNPSRPARKPQTSLRANPALIPSRPHTPRAPAIAGALFSCWPRVRPNQTKFPAHRRRAAV